jgi:hypothetical protein
MSSKGNKIHNFISSSGSGTVDNYGSGSGNVDNYGSGSEFLTSYGSASQKVTVPVLRLRFLQFRFRFQLY